MSTFALENMEMISGRQHFDMLLVDNHAPFQTFTDEIEEQYKGELHAIYAYMEDVANLKTLPETKFRVLKGKNDGIKEFEFKSKHLRVYCIQQVGGKIVVIGGYKNSQAQDIRQFRSLKKQYLQSLKKK